MHLFVKTKGGGQHIMNNQYSNNNNNNNNNTNYDLRESQEELDGADYDLNANHGNNMRPLGGKLPQQQPPHIQRPATDFRAGNALLPKLNANNAGINLSNRSNASYTNPNNAGGTMNQQVRRNDPHHQQMDQLDEYYTVITPA